MGALVRGAHAAEGGRSGQAVCTLGEEDLLWLALTRRWHDGNYLMGWNLPYSCLA